MKVITTVELSELLNGFNVEDKFTRNVVKLAKDSNLVIVSAIGDDTITFSGALTDEFDLLHGGQIFLSREDGECLPYTKNNKDKTRREINVFWEQHSYFKWKFLTLIKHTTYDLKKDNKNFCKGIIFNLSDI